MSDPVEQLEKKFTMLAEGQDVLSAVLIGRPHIDGTVTIGLVAQVEQIHHKQEETSAKVDAILADMSDVKSNYAKQDRLLDEHTKTLRRIEGWLELGVQHFKTAITWAGKGLATLIGIGVLHLVTLWWPVILKWLTTWSWVADAAVKGRH